MTQLTDAEGREHEQARCDGRDDGGGGRATTGAVGAAEAPVVPQPDGGAAATAPIVVSPPQATLVTEQEMFGSGPSGSGNELPDCAG